MLNFEKIILPSILVVSLLVPSLAFAANVTPEDQLKDNKTVSTKKLKFMKETAKKNGIELTDEQKYLKVVIENLLDNGIRYAKSTLSISLKKNENTSILCIHNDGEPIDEKILPNLFNQFHKGNKGKFRLGLAIVKQIIIMFI